MGYCSKPQLYSIFRNSKDVAKLPWAETMQYPEWFLNTVEPRLNHCQICAQAFYGLTLQLLECNRGSPSQESWHYIFIVENNVVVGLTRSHKLASSDRFFCWPWQPQPSTLPIFLPLIQQLARQRSSTLLVLQVSVLQLQRSCGVILLSVTI